MEKCCVVFQGRYYTDIKYIKFIFKTKKAAIEKCRQDGYKFNKKQGLFLNESTQNFRLLELHDINKQ